jgi:hypothetical protein
LEPSKNGLRLHTLQISDRTTMALGCTDLNETNANIFYFESSFTHIWFQMIKSLQDRVAIRTM